MLTINAFRPVNNNYSAQNQSNSNFRKTQFQLGADSCSFKAGPNPRLEYYVKLSMERYPNLLCENFEAMFTKPFEGFLNIAGLSIRDERIKTAGPSNKFKSILTALNDKGHFVTVAESEGHTINDANIRLIEKLLDTEYASKLPQEFKQYAITIRKEIDQFLKDFKTSAIIDKGFYSEDQKAKDIIAGLNTLMPEK